MRLTLPTIDPMHIEQHAAIIIMMSDANQGAVRKQLYPELFVQLARQSLLESFARLALAAGKLPQTALVRRSMSLRNQYPSLCIDKGGGSDMNQLRHQERYSALIFT